MELSSRESGKVRVVLAQGRLDHASDKAFETALAPYLAACTEGGAPLVLDFSGVPYISSVGLRALMVAAKQAEAQRGRIAIASLTPVVAEVFEISHFHLVLQVFADVEGAVAALGA